MEKLSVTLITFNEEKNIERCLESVCWADEIVVLDSFSTDKTVEICRRFTDKVFQEEWQGYGKQKNICAAKALHQWVLNIDADEVVSADCAREIQEEMKKGFSYPLYRFPRKNFFGRRWVRHGGWYPDRIFRLYDKTKVAFTEVPVHEKLVPDNVYGSFKNPLEHYSYDGMDDFVSRQNHYSTLHAREMVRQGNMAGWCDLLLRPPMTFFKMFFLRQGFREGFLGFFLACSTAYYTFLKYGKTRSLDP